MDDYTKLLVLAGFELLVVIVLAALYIPVSQDAVAFQTYKPLWQRISNGSYEFAGPNVVLKGWACYQTQSVALPFNPSPGASP